MCCEFGLRRGFENPYGKMDNYIQNGEESGVVFLTYSLQSWVRLYRALFKKMAGVGEVEMA